MAASACWVVVEELCAVVLCAHDPPPGEGSESGGGGGSAPDERRRVAPSGDGNGAGANAAGAAARVVVDGAAARGVVDPVLMRPPVVAGFPRGDTAGGVRGVRGDAAAGASEYLHGLRLRSSAPWSTSCWRRLKVARAWPIVFSGTSMVRAKVQASARSRALSPGAPVAPSITGANAARSLAIECRWINARSAEEAALIA